MDCRAAATALPGVDTLAVLVAASPAGLSPAALVDAVIAAERLLAQVNGVQVRLLAELGRPNRCADVSDLVSALVDKAGVGRGPDGAVSAAEVAAVTADRSVGVAAAEVAAVLDWSPVTARIRIAQAMRMVQVLPATAAALEQGRVDVGRARMIVDRTAVLAAGLCGPIERRILPLVKGRSKARLETLVDREVIAADPAAAEHRRLLAVKGRSVSHRVDKDGMGVINALLPAESAVLVFTLVDLIAAGNKGLDGRNVDQRRADALADIADELLTYGFVDLDGLVARADHAAGGATLDPETSAPETSAAAPDAEPQPDTDTDADRAEAKANAGGADAADAGSNTASSADDRGPANNLGPVGAGVAVPEPAVAGADRAGRLARAVTRHGRRPHLTVTGAWTTLAGLDELPGHLEGHSTITADLLRAIATSWGSVTAVGVDPASGTGTAVGALTYRPGRRVSDQVIAVSGTCRAAGCRMPADKCDLDHVQPFDHRDPATGGLTTAAGLLPECRFHHLLKHHAGWIPQLQPDMTVVWTTATCHTATSYPREFTSPGEWERVANPGGEQGCARPHAGEAGGGALPTVVDDPPPPSPDNPGHPTAGQQLGPDGDRLRRGVIIGPVVAGPTIPVVPAGTDHHEPHTELEDPATIPHPGSVEITSYRILREDTRRHALRRIHRLTNHPAPDPGTSPTRDPSPTRDASFDHVSDTPAAERDEIDRRYRVALQRSRTEVDTPTLPWSAPLLDLIAQSANEPLPDEPPF